MILDLNPQNPKQVHEILSEFISDQQEEDLKS